MKLFALMENTVCREDLTAEHGLSLYIETGNQKILFDAGQSDAFADNAQKMQVDLTGVDFAVLSHGHYDHGGGLAKFLAINPTAPVYVSREAFGEYYNGSEKYIGLDASLQKNPRIRFAGSRTPLGDGITLWGPEETTPFPIRPFGLTVKHSSTFAPETFRHEQYLLIEEQGKRILISGCSHRGILNIMHRFQPDVCVGGFHFMKLSPDSEELRRAAELLADYPTTYFTGHCTGQAQYDAMKQILGDRLHALSSGAVFEI